MTERGMRSTFSVVAFRTLCQVEGAMSGYDSALCDSLCSSLVVTDDNLAVVTDDDVFDT